MDKKKLLPAAVVSWPCFEQINLQFHVSLIFYEIINDKNLPQT